MYVRETISLGQKCQTSWFLRTRGLRRATYIFDNMISREVDSVTNLLLSNFNDMFLEKNIEVVHRNSWGCLTILDRETGLFSVHDFPQHKEVEDSLPDVQRQKMDAGLSMMSLMINCRDNLLFVRVNHETQSLDATMRLYDTLKSIRNGLPFCLFVFQKNPIMLERWGLPNLVTFYDGPWEWDKARGGWQGNIELWESAFQDVKLKQSKVF